MLNKLDTLFSPSSLGNQQTQQPREGGDLGLVTTQQVTWLPHFSKYSRFPEQGQDFSQVNRNALLELVPS